MKIRIEIKGGKDAEVVKNENGVEVVVTADRPAIIGEVVLSCDDRKLGTLFINQNGNSRWKS